MIIDNLDNYQHRYSGKAGYRADQGLMDENGRLYITISLLMEIIVTVRLLRSYCQCFYEENMLAVAENRG